MGLLDWVFGKFEGAMDEGLGDNEGSPTDTPKGKIADSSTGKGIDRLNVNSDGSVEWVDEERGHSANRLPHNPDPHKYR